MAARAEIVQLCDELLDAGGFEDFGPNGLQVPGAPEITKVVSGVSANLALIERALGAGAELLIVHHGLFWSSQPRALSESQAARLRAALGAGLNVVAYHLPLDAHPEIGNNAQLCAGLGLEPYGGFAAVGGRPIGLLARAPEPISPAALGSAIGSLLDREPLPLGGGAERIERVAVLSGGGAGHLGEAAALGVDAFITGEPAEYVQADAREAGVHFYAAGHHASERLGIRRLGELLGERFGIEHEFIDVPNPV